ncbi:hypothetical protein V501_01507, partial [Pseudogymnoascus sp. VKM F-4519 (FW-2642)]
TGNIQIINIVGMRLPQEICDAIVLCVENEANCISPYKGFNPRRNAVQYLTSLRLVNRGFCAIASPLLFRHIVAICVPFQKESPLVRLIEISKSPYAVYVQRLDVGFRFFDNLSAESVSLYQEDLAGILPGCLARLPNIKALGFHDASFSLPWENETTATKTVIAALRYGLLSSLTELEFTLPLAPDFGKLLDNKPGTLQIPIENTLRGLRHLGLHIGGKLSPYTHSDRTHAFYIFQLVELAVNITSLAISSDSLIVLTNFEFTRLLRLKHVDLEGVETSADDLTSLITQSKESIRSIRFHKITINSGLWESIFRQMGRLSHLFDVDIGPCGYSSTGATQRLATQPQHPPTWPQAILSQNVNDGSALRNLLLQVNTNRIAAGLPTMPEGPVRSRRGAQRSTTTYGYRRALKDIRQPGKRATPEDRNGYKKLLEELRKREDHLTKAKPGKKNGENDSGEDEEYEVESLLDSRVKDGELRFYVLWKGFSMEEATWEPRSNLENSTETIDEYFDVHPGNPGGPKANNRLGRPSLKATEKAT